MKLNGNESASQSLRSKTAEHFDALAETYDNTADWVRDQKIVDLVCSRVKLLPVLDIASGPGFLARAVEARDPHTAFAVDISLPMCRKAQATGLRVVQGATEQLPFRDRSVGTIVCRQGLHYVDFTVALSEWSRILSPEGVAVVAQIGSSTEAAARWWCDVKTLTQPLRRRWFTAETIGALLKQAQWKLIWIDVVPIRSIRHVRRFFAETNVEPPEGSRLLKRLQETAPPSAEFVVDTESVSFVQEWLVWVMHPIEEVMR